MLTAIPYSPGPLPVIFGIADDIGMLETINELLEWDPAQCEVSSGHRLLDIAANFLTECAALVHLEEFYEQTDTDGEDESCLKQSTSGVCLRHSMG